MSVSACRVRSMLGSCTDPATLRHTVFGRIVEGMDVVQYIEKVPKGPGDKPAQDVIVKDSGELAASDEKVKEEL